MDTASSSLTEQAPSERMWREVIEQLRGFVRRRIADRDRAEDLVGDILLRIYQNLSSIDDQEKLAHWVSRVARNAVIDEYRRAARAREQLVASPTDTAAVDARWTRTTSPACSTSSPAACARCLPGCHPSSAAPSR